MGELEKGTRAHSRQSHLMSRLIATGNRRNVSSAVLMRRQLVEKIEAASK